MKKQKISSCLKNNSLIFFLVFAGVLFLAMNICGCSSFTQEKFNLNYKIYVPNVGTSNVTIVPPTNSNQIKKLTLFSNADAESIYKDPTSNDIFVLLSTGNDIQTINSSSDTMSQTFKFQVGSNTPQANKKMVFTPDGSKAYISTTFQGAGIAVMRLSDRSFTTGINVNSISITDMFFSADGSTLYALDPEQAMIYQINTATDQALLDQNIKVPDNFGVSLYEPDTGYFLLASGAGSDVNEFDPVSRTYVRKFQNVTSGITRMAIKDDLLYAVGTNEIVTFNFSNATLDKRVNLQSKNATDIQFLSDNSYIVVPSASAGTLMLLDPDKLTLKETINVGSHPGQMIIFPKS